MAKSIEMLAFDNSYARLPARFYARVAPTKVGDPRVIRVNQPLAELLGASSELLASSTGAALLVGNEIPSGAEPLALAYAGHQFGGFVPQLGDGRAILLGEVVGKDGLRRDIPAQGLRTHAVFAWRRRTRRAWPRPARVPRQRGDGGAGHTDHACPRRRDDG